MIKERIETKCEERRRTSHENFTFKVTARFLLPPPRTCTAALNICFKGIHLKLWMISNYSALIAMLNKSICQMNAM